MNSLLVAKSMFNTQNSKFNWLALPFFQTLAYPKQVKIFTTQAKLSGQLTNQLTDYNYIEAQNWSLKLNINKIKQKVILNFFTGPRRRL